VYGYLRLRRIVWHGSKVHVPPPWFGCSPRHGCHPVRRLRRVLASCPRGLSPRDWVLAKLTHQLESPKAWSALPKIHRGPDQIGCCPNTRSHPKHKLLPVIFSKFAYSNPDRRRYDRTKFYRRHDLLGSFSPKISKPIAPANTHTSARLNENGLSIPQHDMFKKSTTAP